MKDLTTKERTAVLVLAAAVAASVAYSSDRLLVDGILGWGIRQKEYLAVIGELAALFAALAVIFRFFPSFWTRAAGAGIVAAVFLWAHRAFAAVAVSGLYAGYLREMGRCLLRRLGEREKKESGMTREFLVGCLFVVCMFCLMSALGVGRISYLWISVLVTGTAAAADRWIKREPGIRQWKSLAGERGGQSFAGACLLAGTAVFLCLQAGRMNIAVDYDSLWYGVRSPYILDNGRGIYEDMGTIGIVYTYSKGFEVLTLPLSVLPSFSFSIAFNLWLAVGVLWIAGRAAALCAGKKAGQTAVCFLASVPGIMNMSITAKSDMATLFFQMLMFYEILLFLKKDRQALWYAFAAFFFSWTLKPTSLVFSTAVMGMSVVFLAAERELLRVRGSRGGAAALALSVLALAGIWARTLLITGLPVTSVFSSIFTRLGFKMKYPFNVQKIPNSSAGVSKIQWVTDMAKRIWGVLFNPQGPDMDHVILAWGSLAVWFLICVWGVCLFLDKKARSEEEKKLDRYLSTVFWPFFGCCGVSLLLLTQVDGNYFMLFYVLLAICVFRMTARLNNHGVTRVIRNTGIPVVIFSGVIMMLTNWGWAVGFTPVSWRHKGYYDHQALWHEQMVFKGNARIWDILAENPRNRLIAIGEHPEVLAFPCSVQSYADITGTWGNVALVRHMDDFVEFMRYAKTDYVYTQAWHISEDERAWSLTCDLIEYGVLTPVCFEHGNMLARVDTEGERTEESVGYLQEFLENYQKGEN